jgi:arabinogalactan oligomer/maltooligosaccharide transport system permease protein
VERKTSTLPWWQVLYENIYEFIASVIKIIVNFAWAILLAFVNLFIYGYRSFVWIALSLFDGSRNFINTFVQGNWKTKLSFFVMGSGSFLNGQLTKGILYFIVQMLYTLIMLFFGFGVLSQVSSLGTQASTPTYFDEELGVYFPAQSGDNSMLILLFSVGILLLTAAYLILYIVSINTAYENENKITRYSYSYAPFWYELKKQKIIGQFTVREYILRKKSKESPYHAFWLSNHKALLENELLLLELKHRIDTASNSSNKQTAINDWKNQFVMWQRKKKQFQKEAKSFSRTKISLSLKKDSGYIALKNQLNLVVKTFIMAEQKARDKYLPSSFKKDIADFLDQKFHITVLSFPTLAVFAFTILPLIFMILIAFTNFDVNNQPPANLFTWVGFDNFINMFSGNSAVYAQMPQTLYSILQWSLVWALFATFSNYFLGMILAIMINKQGIKFKKLWRTVFVTTIAVPQFISLLVMARILDDNGPIVYWLVSNDWVRSNFSFFFPGSMARITVILVNIWVGVPYTMLITSGILMNIPVDLYESATIDGAGPITKFFKITLPYMLFVTGPYLVTSFIGNINNFNVIFFLTGGGPGNLGLFRAGDTDLLVTWLFNLTLNERDYKMASAIGIIIFTITSFFSLIMFSKTASFKKEEEFQ